MGKFVVHHASWTMIAWVLNGEKKVHVSFTTDGYQPRLRVEMSMLNAGQRLSSLRPNSATTSNTDGSSLVSSGSSSLRLMDGLAWILGTVCQFMTGVAGTSDGIWRHQSATLEAPLQARMSASMSLQQRLPRVSKITYESTAEIEGFEIENCDLSDAYGGDAEDKGFYITTGSSSGIVIAFSFEGESITEGSGTLLTLEGSMDDECYFIFSDDDGHELSYDLEIVGCTDNKC